MRYARRAAAAAMLVFALNSGAFAVQMLVNRGFENADDHTTGWTLTNVPVDQYAGAWQAPGLRPSGSGSWGLDLVNNFGISTGRAVQAVTLTPGEYEISVSSWVRLFSGVGEGVSSASIRLVVDGTNVQMVTFNGVNGGWTAWTQISTPVWTGQVNNFARLRLDLVADGTGGWGQAVADDLRMDVTAIPEPVSGILLAAGSVVLLARRRRHA